MAEFIQDVILRMKTDTSSAKKGIDDVGEASKKAEQKSGGLGSTLKGLAPALGAAAIVKGLIDIGKASLAAYDVQAKAEAKVLQTIKSTNMAAGRSLDQLKAQASALQKETLFGDEEILKGATATLLTFTNIAEEQFDKAQQAVLDVATAMGTDLQSSALQIGKALNAPVEGMAALSESGIQFTKQQKDVVKQLVETGRAAEAQEVILAELNKQFGGQAAAAAKAGLGFWTQFKNTLGDVTELIGEYLLKVTGLIKEEEKQQVTLEKTRIEMNHSFEVLKDGNLVQASRNKLIDEINTKYGRYLPNLLTEKSSLQEIENAQKQANKQLLFKIALLNFEEERNKILEEQAAKIDFLTTSQISYNKKIKELQEYGASPAQIEQFKQFTKTQEEQQQVAENISNDATKLLNELEAKYKEMASLIGVSFEDFFKEQESNISKSDNILLNSADKEKAAAKQKAKTILEVYNELNQKLVELSEQKDQLIKLSSQGATDEIQAQLDDLLNQTENQISDITDKLDEFRAAQLKNITIDPIEVIEVIVNEQTIEDLLKKSSENIKPIEYTPPIEITLTEKIEKFKENFSQITSAITDLIDSLGIGDRIQKEIDKYDALIAKQEDVVNKTREIASNGNADQLKLEEDRLKSLESAREADQKKKEQAEKRALKIKQGIALAEIAINLAREISAINTKAAEIATSIPGPAGVAASSAYRLTQIPQAVVLSAVQATAVLSQLLTGFHDGTEFVTGKKGRDKIPAMVEYGERIVNADQNKKISQKLGYTPTNDELVKMVLDSKKLGIDNKGLLVNLNVNKKERQEVNELIDINKKMLKALQRNGINIQVDEDGFAIRTQSIVDRNKILDSI